MNEYTISAKDTSSITGVAIPGVYSPNLVEEFYELRHNGVLGS
jgi:hypothetical protein